MKLTSAFLALVAIAGVNAQQNQQRCSRIATRKEIRNLSASEWWTVQSTLKRMNDYGWFAWFAYLHAKNFDTVHSCEMFMPWHRRFLQDFESIAMRFNPAFVLPYWDELRDFANPAGSAIFASNYLGGNGQGSNRCVTSGAQGGWTLSYPNNHCLRRQYNNGRTMNPWYSPEYIQSVLARSPSMTDLRPGLEYSLHGAIHLAVGGDMNSDPSPNDFIFWLHHANIDRLWNVWQNTGNHLWDITGVDARGQRLTLDSSIAAYNEPIRTVMQLGYGNQCYQYDNGRSVTRRDVIQKRDAVAPAPSLPPVQKCIPRPPPSTENPVPTTAPPAPVYKGTYVPDTARPAVPPLVQGVFNNVNDLKVNSDAYIKDHIIQKLPDHILDKWFPAPGANRNYTAVPVPSGYPTASASDAEESGEDHYSTASATSKGHGKYKTKSHKTKSRGHKYTSRRPGYSHISEALPTESASDIYRSTEEAHIYSQEYKAYEEHKSDPSYGLDNQVKYAMPIPAPMTPGWIAMHKFDPKEIQKHYQLAKEFVRELNAAGYQSPFAKTYF
ncbi:hypothetical protein GGI12_005430 [Dipsacomyces acuminosporus]|nr:hypothetical protein GGI12_005430 [Dipsacomyces acuminosporus]